MRASLYATCLVMLTQDEMCKFPSNTFLTSQDLQERLNVGTVALMCSRSFTWQAMLTKLGCSARRIVHAPRQFAFLLQNDTLYSLVLDKTFSNIILLLCFASEAWINRSLTLWWYLDKTMLVCFFGKRSNASLFVFLCLRAHSSCMLRNV